MASRPLTEQELNITIYQCLISETNRYITESSDNIASIEAFKRHTSYLLRIILYNIYERLYTRHFALLNDYDKQYIHDCIKTLFLNIHTKYGTTPIFQEDIVERPAPWEEHPTGRE